MTDISRRHAFGILGALPTPGLAPAQAEEAGDATLDPATPFDPEMNIARALVGAPYAPPPAVSLDWLDLSCDNFRGIWFVTRHTLLRGTLGAVQAEIIVAGLCFPHKISIKVIEKGRSREVQFQLRLFDTIVQFPALPGEGTGFDGFRLLGEMEVDNRIEEYAVCLEASCFRTIGRGQAYDISARGLALTKAADGPDYNDLVAHCERRPSLWGEPLCDWGSGAVMPVEIPTEKEINDNIVRLLAPPPRLWPQEPSTASTSDFTGARPAPPMALSPRSSPPALARKSLRTGGCSPSTMRLIPYLATIPNGSKPASAPVRARFPVNISKRPPPRTVCGWISR